MVEFVNESESFRPETTVASTGGNTLRPGQSNSGVNGYAGSVKAELSEIARKVAEEESKISLPEPLATPWVAYKRATDLIMQFCRLASQAESHRLDGMLLWGPPNNGKTSIARQFQEKFNAKKPNIEGKTLHPVVFVDCPPKANVSSLCEEILTAVGAPIPRGRGAVTLRTVVEVLIACECKVLIIDEIHNGLIGGRDSVEEFRNTLKYFSNTLRVPLILIGTEKAKSFMQGDAQFSSRYEPYELKAWSNDKDFAKLLFGMSTASSLDRKQFSKVAIVDVFHAKSSGYTGEAWRLISRCDALAKMSGETDLLTLVRGIPYTEVQHRRL